MCAETYQYVLHVRLHACRLQACRCRLHACMHDWAHPYLSIARTITSSLRNMLLPITFGVLLVLNQSMMGVSSENASPKSFRASVALIRRRRFLHWQQGQSAPMAESTHGTACALFQLLQLPLLVNVCPLGYAPFWYAACLRAQKSSATSRNSVDSRPT